MPRKNKTFNRPQPQYRAVEQLEEQLRAEWRRWAKAHAEREEQKRIDGWATKFRREYGTENN